MKETVSNDRRFQRTHELIINSAIEMALHIGWQKVRITHLAEKANINRNSFYLHFQTMGDLFDEVDERFLVKYRIFVRSSPSLEIMVKDPDYYEAFSDFLKSEEDYFKMIHTIGRSDILISKIEKIWMSYFDTELSLSPKYRNAKEIILPYIAGCTMIFFTNWANNPTEFDIKRNTLFNREFIEHILAMESKSD